MILLLIPYIAALALVVLELRGLLGGGELPSRRRPSPHGAPWWIAVLLASYATQLIVVWYAATHETPLAAWRAAMPFPVVFLGVEHGDVASSILLALGLLQSIALSALYRASISRSLLVAGMAAMIAFSLAAPALTSFDVYGYVHDALLGIAGYAPTTMPFPGEFHVFDLWFVTPRPVIYGPLWIPIVKLATGLPTSLAGKIVSYRIFSAGLFLALLALLRALRLPRRIVAIAALNPGLAFQFVANAHNDLIAVDLILAGAVLLRRYGLTAVAFGCVALAGTFKLPYALLGLPIFSTVRPLSVRLTGCAAVILATLAFTWFGGGIAYVHALAAYSHSIDYDAMHALPFAVAVAAIVAAVFGKRRLRTAVWLFPVFGAFRLPLVFPWYLAFGLPYAIARHNVARYLLVWCPFVTALLVPEFMRPWTLLVVFPLAVFASLRWTQRRYLAVKT